MLVIACNSASAAVLRDARERYDVPVVEVIQPAVRRAVARHPQRPGRRHRHPGHRHERRLRRRLRRRTPDHGLTSRACPRFVEFVEAGVTGGDELLDVAHDYLDPVAAAGVDTLVLGCTHYPLLTGVISYVMGDDVTLVSSAEETAKDVYRVLAAAASLRAARLPEPAHRFLATGDPRRSRRSAAASSAPRSARSTARREASSALMRLTVVGCSGIVPGPGLAGLLLPRRARRLPACCSTSATAPSVRCSATSDLRRHRRRAAQPPARRPLHRPRAPLRRAHATDPAGRSTALPVYGPTGSGEHMARAYGRRRPSARRVFDFASGPSEPSTSARSRSTRRGSTTRSRRTGSALEHGGRTLAYSGDTGPATRWSSWRAAPTCCCARRRSSRATTTRRTCT